MKRTMIILVLVSLYLCIAPFATADITTFTFADMEDSQDNLVISGLLIIITVNSIRYSGFSFPY